MNTKDLKYFLRVCQHKNITNAAKSLFVSQQTLSASIARLEKEWNTTLFTRSQKGVELTKAGQYLYIEAQKLLSIDAEIGQFMSNTQAMPANLRVGCAYGVVHELPGKMLNLQELAQKKIRPKYIEFTDIACEKAVADGTVDVGFAIGPIDSNLFESQFLISRKFCFMIHKSHPLARCGRLHVWQLKGENIIILNDQFKAYHLLQSLCAEHGFSPNYVYEAGEIAPIRNLVQQNYGVGISTDFIARGSDLALVTAMPLADAEFTWNVHLIWKKGSPLSIPAAQFIDYII